MFYENAIPLFIIFLVLPQVVVHGGLGKELLRKFVGFFKWSTKKPDLSYNGCNLCSFGPCTPMVWPSNDKNFDGSVDAEEIMQSYGSSSSTGPNQMATVEKILTTRSASQRTAVAEAFKKKYNKQIIDKLFDVASIWYVYYIFIRTFSLPLPQAYSEQIRYAIIYQGSAQDYQQGQATIIEILTTLPKCLIDKVIESYNSKDKQDLIPDLNKSLERVGKPLEYREVMKKLIEQKRDTSQHASWIKALKDAYKLKSAVTSQKESEMKEKFFELFIKCSIPQIIETIVVYENLRFGDKEFQSLFDDICKYTGGEKDIYKIMVSILKNKPMYYAKTIEEILPYGPLKEVHQRRLAYLIAGRYDIDLKDIIHAYNQQSKTGFRADFVAWDSKGYAKAFHPLVLRIIDRA